MKFFGTIKRDKKEGEFVIRAEPHVMLRLKRHFPRVSQHLSELRITDTLEVCRDIEWFFERFPLTATKGTLGYIVERSRAHEKHEEMTERITTRALPGEKFELAEPARDYQLIAAELAYHTKGLLLADEMGLGKTISAICLFTRPETRPVLVATKTALPGQWERQVNRFAPSLTTKIVKKGSPVNSEGKRYEIGKLVRGADGKPVMVWPDVVITNHHKLAGWRDEFCGMFQTVVWDEGQCFRSPDSQMSRAAAHIRSKATWCMMLSGTPIHNLGHEMHAIVEQVSPGALGDKREFTQEWCGAEDRRGRSAVKDPAALGTYLRAQGLMLRRTRKDVGRELPGFTKVVEYIDTDQKKLQEIQGSALELARIILARSGNKKGDAFEARGRFEMEMRQVTGLAKAVAVAEFVEMAIENGEQVLLSGWHRGVYDIWKEKLKHYSPQWFTGSESGAAKEKSAEAFIKGDSRLLIMSLRSGEGLDGLQSVCKTVVHGELDWSPAVHEQLDTRIFRDGQEHPVISYYLLSDSDESSDPVLADLLGLKREQLEGIRDPLGGFKPTLDLQGDAIKKMAENYLRKVQA